jgi:hypothetical protein
MRFEGIVEEYIPIKIRSNGTPEDSTALKASRPFSAYLTFFFSNFFK